MGIQIVSMATTIQVSQDLLKELKSRKIYDKESYEEVIWDLLEDSKELSKETLQNLKEAEEDVKAGRVISHEQLKRELGIK